MPFLRKILNILLLLPLLAVPACSSDDPDVPDAPTEPEAAGYLQLVVSTAGSSAYSRSNPTGGENGDGPEVGLDNENNIYNLCIFIYRDLGGGLDGENNPIKWTHYYSTTDPIRPINWHEIRIPLSDDDLRTLSLANGVSLRTIVVANAGDIREKFLTVGDICGDKTKYNKAWQGDAVGDANYFIMSSAFNGAKRTDAYKNDGEVYFAKSNTEGVIYSCQVTLERVAARIDLQVSTDNIIKEGETPKYLKYTVTGNSGNTLRITNVIPVNLMKNNSYLVKHVSPGVGTMEDLRMGGFLMAADETLSNGTPTNYVWTPDFDDKPFVYENTVNPYINPARTLRDPLTDLTAMSKVSSELLGTAYKFEGAGNDDRTIILTYANENTHHADVQKTHSNGVDTFYPSDHLTGLLLRAQYHPATLYTDGACTSKRDYVDGETFWLFRKVATAVKEENNLYFASEDALNDYVASIPAGGEYETAEYPGGICYYNIWIKHANDGTDDNIPMKYGIVRNNIYRISFSFTGIGQPTPEITEPYAVVPRIYVIKWNFRPQPEIIM